MRGQIIGVPELSGRPVDHGKDPRGQKTDQGRRGGLRDEALRPMHPEGTWERPARAEGAYLVRISRPRRVRRSV